MPYPLRVAAAVSWRLLAVAGLLIVIGYVVIQLSVVFIPIAVGLLVTALLAPAVNACTRARIPRALATAMVVVVGVAALGGMLAFVVQAFVDGLPELQAQVNETIAGLQRYLRDPPFGLPAVELDSIVDRARQALQENRAQITSGALATAYTLVDFVTGLVLATFVVIVFMYQGGSIWKFLVKVVPATSRDRVDVAGQRSYAALVGYVRATVLVAVIDAVGIGIGLAAVGAPLVVPLTALVFLSAFIPVVGAVLSGILAVLVVLVANGPVAALVVLAVVLGVQQIEGSVLQPLIMGRAVALGALAVVLAVTVGTLLAGITGALLSVPLLAALNAGIRSLVRDDPAVDPVAVEQDRPMSSLPAPEQPARAGDAPAADPADDAGTDRRAEPAADQPAADRPAPDRSAADRPAPDR